MNPFILGRQVHAAEHIGRRAELRDVINRLWNDDCSLVIGESRIGKSSLLHAVRHEGPDILSQRVEQCVFIFLCCDQFRDRDPIQFWKSVLQQARDQFRLDSVKAEFETCLSQLPDDPTTVLARFLPHIGAQSMRIIVLLDDIDDLAYSDQFGSSFFRVLRPLVTAQPPALLVVGASSTPHSDLQRDLSKGGSPVLNNFVPVRLRSFDRSEVEELFERALAKTNFKFDQLSKNWIWARTRGHPWLVQHLASYMFDELTAGRDQSEARDAAQKLFDNQKGAAFDALRRFGKYEQLERLGTGGMGVVYCAHDPELERLVAIKVIKQTPTDALEREELNKRLEREGKVLATLRHKGIPLIFDSRLRDPLPYIVMEYVRGDNLLEVRKRLSVEPTTIMRWLRTMADILAYAHDKNVIHRDVKPENIISVKEDDLVLVDWGIALDSQSSRLTASGVRIGTRGYRCPELDMTDKSDIYSLGGTGLFLLLGQHPGENPIDEIERVSPSPLKTALCSMLEREPTRRPSAVELLRILS